MERIVTAIVPVNNSKSRIFINEEFAFVLYKGELRRYKIKIGEYVSEEVYLRITEEVLPKRARERMLNLVSDTDKTEYQIREKLRLGEYSEEIIDQTIELGKKHKFIDDRRYAENYVFFQKEKKSLNAIKMELRKRGVSANIISEFTEAEDSVDEISSIMKMLPKKIKDKENLDYLGKQKVFAYFARKGYSYDAISSAISKYLDIAED